MTALLVGLAALAYGSSLNHFFLSDDFIWLAKVHSGSQAQPLPEHLSRLGVFRPVFYLYVRTMYLFFGTSAFGWNFFQLVLHCGNCLLLAWLVGRYFNNNRMGYFAAACFALHFINVEAVFWLSAASYTLAAFFALLMFVLYIRFKETGSRILYFTSFLSAVLALLSNEQAIGLFLILPLIEFRFPGIKGGRHWTFVPYFILAFLYARFRLSGLEFRPPGGAYHLAGILDLLKNYLFLFVGSLVRPDFMALLKKWRAFQATGDFAALLSGLAEKPGLSFVLLCTPLVYATAFLLSKTSRFFILWSMAAFLPAALFSGTGERLLYLPLAGLSVLVPFWLVKLSERVGGKKLIYLPAVLWAGYLFAVQQQSLEKWKFASSITRQTVETIGQTAQSTGRPITVCVEKAPDHYDEAWVFRMGFEQLGELFYPEGLVQTKLRSERDCPADSNRRLFLGEFQNYRLVLQPGVEKTFLSTQKSF